MHLARSTTELPGRNSGSPPAQAHGGTLGKRCGPGDCFYRAAFDAHAAGNTFFWINDGPVVRSLCRFLQTEVRGPAENTAAITAAVTRADKLRRLRSHGESIEREVNMPHLFEFAKELQRLVPVKHGFPKWCLGWQPYKIATLHGHLAVMVPQYLLLPFTNAINHEETLLPFEMSFYIKVGLHQLRLERAPHRNDAE